MAVFFCRLAFVVNTNLNLSINNQFYGKQQITDCNNHVAIPGTLKCTYFLTVRNY